MQSISSDRSFAAMHPVRVDASSEHARPFAPAHPAPQAPQADTTPMTRAQAAESAIEDLSASFGDITAQAAHDVMQDAPALAPQLIARRTSILARERWTPEAHGAHQAPPSAGGVAQHLRRSSLQRGAVALPEAAPHPPAPPSAPDIEDAGDGRVQAP